MEDLIRNFIKGPGGIEISGPVEWVFAIGFAMLLGGGAYALANRDVEVKVDPVTIKTRRGLSS